MKQILLTAQKEEKAELNKIIFEFFENINFRNFKSAEAKKVAGINQPASGPTFSSSGRYGDATQQVSKDAPINDIKYTILSLIELEENIINQFHVNFPAKIKLQEVLKSKFEKTILKQIKLVTDIDLLAKISQKEFIKKSDKYRISKELTKFTFNQLYHSFKSSIIDNVSATYTGSGWSQITTNMAANVKSTNPSNFPNAAVKTIRKFLNEDWQKMEFKSMSDYRKMGMERNNKSTRVSLAKEIETSTNLKTNLKKLEANGSNKTLIIEKPPNMNLNYKRKCFKKFEDGLVVAFGMSMEMVRSEILYTRNVTTTVDAAVDLSSSTSRPKVVEIEQIAGPAGDEASRAPESKRARVEKDDDIIWLD